MTSLLLVIFVIVYSIIFFMILKHNYMMPKWEKLLEETDKINKQNLSGPELVFELEYLQEEHNKLLKLEKRWFPYL